MSVYNDKATAHQKLLGEIIAGPYRGINYHVPHSPVLLVPKSPKHKLKTEPFFQINFKSPPRHTHYNVFSTGKVRSSIRITPLLFLCKNVFPCSAKKQKKTCFLNLPFSQLNIKQPNHFFLFFEQTKNPTHFFVLFSPPKKMN